MNFPYAPLPVELSDWDKIVGPESDQEVLARLLAGRDPELHRWIVYHHFHKFVPEQILAALGLTR